jgi:signal transduction histidine kinase
MTLRPPPEEFHRLHDQELSKVGVTSDRQEIRMTAAAQTTLRQRTLEVRQTNDQLTLKLEEMERFLHTVSHDLKSPIIAIKGFLEILKEGIKENNQEDIAEAIMRIERIATQMGATLESLLQFSGVGGSGLSVKKLDMNRLIRHVVEDQQAQLKSSGAAVTVQEGLPPIVADAERVRDVFENLLGNANKYGGSTGKPIIEIGSAQTDNETRFFVRDNGPGIEPQNLLRVFDLFYRGNRKIAGSGVGLAIVRRVMEIHGGRAWVESEPGKGATFWVAFPNRTLTAEEP